MSANPEASQVVNNGASFPKLFFQLSILSWWPLVGHHRYPAQLPTAEASPLQSLSPPFFASAHHVAVFQTNALKQQHCGGDRHLHGRPQAPNIQSTAPHTEGSSQIGIPCGHLFATTQSFGLLASSPVAGVQSREVSGGSQKLAPDTEGKERPTAADR